MNILETRKKSGLSQEEVASNLGITRLSYNAKEKGKTRFYVDELEKLLEMFSNCFDDDAQEIIIQNTDLPIRKIENFLELLADMNCLTPKGRAIKHSIRKKYIRK